MVRSTGASRAVKLGTMKATLSICHLTCLSLLSGTDSGFATATTTTSGGRRDDQPQLTLSNTRPWLTTDDGLRTAQDVSSVSSLDPLGELQAALDVMQNTWFEVWVGTWPSAIDWTAAVMNTHLVSSLSTLSKALNL